MVAFTVHVGKKKTREEKRRRMCSFRPVALLYSVNTDTYKLHVYWFISRGESEQLTQPEL